MLLRFRPRGPDSGDASAGGLRGSCPSFRGARDGRKSPPGGKSPAPAPRSYPPRRAGRPAGSSALRRYAGYAFPATTIALLPLLWALLVAAPAESYKFFGRSRGHAVSSPAAARWELTDIPIFFRLLENAYLPTDWFTPESWRDVVLRGFAHWGKIPTTTIAVHLEDESFAADLSDADDGMNTIGFTADEYWEDSYFIANARVLIEDGRIVGCDIRVSPWIFDRLDDRARENPQKEMERLAWMEMVVAHEVGHCLGLLHTDLNPTWEARTDTPAIVRDGFYPEGVTALHADPIMSYGGWHDLIGLTPDEITAVSLLYPTLQFLETTGAVGGRIVFADGRGVPNAYVQIASGASAAGPHYGTGAFTDRHGQFLLEGLPPGRHLFWVHPLGDLISQLRPERYEATEVVEALDIRDRWFWAEVRAGRVDIGPPLTVSSGRTNP